MSPAVDAAGQTDFGGVDALRLEEWQFSLAGDFGNIRLKNDGIVSVVYELLGHSPSLDR